MKRTILQIAFAVLLCWHVGAMANISVTIDPPAVSLGDTFRLTFTIDNPQGGGIPDLTPLQENFNIVGTERNMSYSIVNGQTQSAGQWTVLLVAKKAGALAIPPIRIGHQESTASSIEVTTNKESITPDNQGIPQDDVMIKTEVSQQEAFINQQVIYTVKLYNSQRLLDAQYQPPSVEDALLIPLGDGRRYNTELNGRSYAVEEQQYAIFPQKSGDLDIASPAFNALVFSNVPKRINARSKTRKLVIKPIPADFKGKYWLPAKQVALTEVYDQTDTTMKQGGTLVRTVTLQANGVPAQLLPTLTFATSSQFNLYPEKPELNNTARQQELIGRADAKVTYVLNKAGQITIPALQVTWFNTDTGKEEIVSLPARTIVVEPTNASAPGNMVKVPPATVDNTQATPLPALPVENSSPLAWWIAAGFALAWIVTLGLWRFRKSPNGRKRDKQLALRALRKACENNNASHTQVALLRWAACQWPDVDVLNVHQLAKLVHDSTMKKQLSLLSQALYSEEMNIEWQGATLWRRVCAYLRAKPTQKGKASDLPPINPG